MTNEHPTASAGDRPRGRRRLWLVFGAAATLAVAAAAVALWPSPSVPHGSGVRGRVWLGPLTPVQRVGGPPNERPYVATIRVLRPGSDDILATVSSGDDGTFSVDLAPGNYVLLGFSPGSAGLPRAAPVPVVVVAHRYTTVAVSFDTGIR